jgi:hypothetical protein
MKPEDYWGMVLPAYDRNAGTIDRSVPDCAGRDVFASPMLQDAEGPRTGAIPAKPEDLLESPGPNGFKVIWLRAQHFANGDAGGPIALVRAREGYGEVYATGVYRGNAKASRFSIERMGPRILVTASDEGCAGVKPGQACQTKLDVLLMSAGKLSPATSVLLDRVEFGNAAGVGNVQYRLSASPVFAAKAFRVAEQVVVRDATQTPIRKSNLERVFVLKDEKLVSSTGSLWDQVVVANTTPPAPPPPPPASTNKPQQQFKGLPKPF